MSEWYFVIWNLFLYGQKDSREPDIHRQKEILTNRLNQPRQAQVWKMSLKVWCPYFQISSGKLFFLFVIQKKKTEIYTTLKCQFKLFSIITYEGQGDDFFLNAITICYDIKLVCFHHKILELQTPPHWPFSRPGRSQGLLYKQPHH